jgi:hypothetical protein
MVITEGGIRMPSVPPAQIVPIASSGLYLRFSMEGRASMPMAATAAPTMPVMAAMIVQMAMVPTARPPGNRRDQSSMAR